MAKHIANDFSEDDCRQLAEQARGVYWARSLYHAAQDLIAQRYPRMEAAETERLARRVAAVAHAQLRREPTHRRQ